MEGCWKFQREGGPLKLLFLNESTVYEDKVVIPEGWGGSFEQKKKFPWDVQCMDISWEHTLKLKFH